MDPSARLFDILLVVLGASLAVNGALLVAVYKHIQSDIDWRDRVAKLEGRLGVNGR